MSPGPDRDRIVDDPEAVVIHDRRRLDPETGQVRPPASWGPGLRGAGPGKPVVEGSVDEGADDVVDEGVGKGTADPDGEPPVESPAEPPVEPAVDRTAELTGDLQRVTAEYANYRKRVDRDRVAVVEMATAGLLSGLLPLLDDIDRARDHGDLTGAFKGVADQLEGVIAKLGLERFGAVGDPFDPGVHEALMQAEPDPDQTVATCAAVLQPGYRLTGGRVLRPARVSVAEPGQT